MAMEKSSSFVRTPGKCSGDTSNVEKQVAASIPNRRRRPAQDVSSCVDSNSLLIADIHRRVTFRASLSSTQALIEVPGSVVESKRRLQIRARTDDHETGAAS